MGKVHMTEVRMGVRDALLKKSVRNELDTLVVELARIDEQQDALKDARKPLIDRFVALSGRHIELDGRSRYWPVSQIGMRVRVTETEPTIPFDYDKLMRLVGPDTFSRVCTVKTAALDVGKWGEELERETVKDTQLQECMGEPRPRSPSVYIEKIPKNGADS